MTNETQNNEDQQILSFAARRATRHEEYLASFLLAFQQQENMSETQLIQFLNCRAESFPRLALCRAPDLHADDFGARVKRIASFVDASPGSLAHILRQVSHIHSLHSAPRRALLLAARDHDGEDTRSSNLDTAQSDETSD